MADVKEKEQTIEHATKLAAVTDALAGMPGTGSDVQSFSEKVNADLEKLGIGLEGKGAETPEAKAAAEAATKAAAIETPEAKAAAEAAAAAAIETPEAKAAAEAAKTAADAAAETPEAKAAAEAAKAAEINNPLIDKGKLQKKGVAAEIKSYDELPAAIKSEFGMEIKEPKDMGTLFNSAKKWKADSQKLAASDKKLADFTKLFELMPETLYDATMAFATGQNWEEVIANKPKLDYKKNAEDLDKKILVKHYFPDKFKDEDFSDAEENTSKQAVDIAFEASKKQFVLDKTTFETKRSVIADNAKRRLDARKSSADISVVALKDSFPDFTEDTQKEIREFLVSKDVNSLFFNADGTYTKDAAKNYVLIKHGFEAIEQLTRAAAKAAETEAIENILERGDDKLKQGKGANITDTPNPLLVQKLKEIEDVAKSEKKIF